MEVKFKDTDGDDVIFRVNASGGIDYHVNGKLKVRNLDQLREQKGSIVLHGVAMGPWNAARRTTPEDPAVISKVLNLGREQPESGGARGRAREVSYKDTDGDDIVFRINETSNNIDYYVNGKLKVRDLDALGQRDDSIVLHGTPMGPFSASRRTTPKDPSVIRAVLLLLNSDPAECNTEEERKGLAVGFKDTDGDHIWFKRSADGSISYWVNDKEKVRELTSLEAVGRTLHLRGTPCDGDPRNTGRRVTTPNNSRVIPRVLALRHGNDELLKPLEIDILLLRTDALLKKTSELSLTSDQVNEKYWQKQGSVSGIFRDEDFKAVKLVDISAEDYAVLSYPWNGSIWSDMARVLKTRLRAEFVWIDIFCLNQTKVDKIQTIREAASIYADASEYHFLGARCLNRGWCMYELAAAVSPQLCLSADFGTNCRTYAVEMEFLDKQKREAAKRTGSGSKKVQDILAVLSPRFDECQFSVEADRAIVQKFVEEQYTSLEKFNEQIAKLLTNCASWKDHVASVSNFLQEEGRTGVGSPEVSFVDTDGDSIVFRVNSDGALDYFVNGKKKCSSLSNLSLDRGTLHLVGTPCDKDPRNSGRRVTTPMNFAAAKRVMSLYSHGDANVSTSVMFTDTDNDQIVFSLNGDGKLDYYVNNKPKVTNLTKLQVSGKSITLDGTSCGNWSSARRTTPRNPTSLKHVMELARGVV
ncbi:hypothetical protein AB1Y20_020064 [Prymnesium parvum]|uniref:Heterokaryon incompatibility domain-containing protein n=1 Tax=Prymnesium parvum TaxID=97485 RepID=A0AB34JSL2_PRYPA